MTAQSRLDIHAAFARIGGALDGTPRRRGLTRKHMLMLALAVEVVIFGMRNADRYSPPGIGIEQTLTQGHVIT